ncbi:hypothetical protein FOIG_03238 [Fusarium odoratissimum NRRL 54006]|uniref:Uncharacterized protein n=1 Tax=Fusarium odoratissimum (strain NRRL 54006) TaxID=1089451 RepID=X0LC84_FUSO5|nr:uncharacterized protein FOIG_03238 [Fusarium odoratissimum NRRL 54006]EXM06445.1 hypothetical protein FOIG_03238 [Fusarium odoratissimum NRRL 54006]
MGRTRILCGSLFSGRRNIRSGQSGCRACMRRTRLSRLPSTSELYGRCMRSRRIKWRIQTERGQSQNQKVHHELLASILGGRVCMERRGEEEALCETKMIDHRRVQQVRETKGFVYDLRSWGFTDPRYASRTGHRPALCVRLRNPTVLYGTAEFPLQ